MRRSFLESRNTSRNVLNASRNVKNATPCDNGNGKVHFRIDSSPLIWCSLLSRIDNFPLSFIVFPGALEEEDEEEAELRSRTERDLKEAQALPDIQKRKQLQTLSLEALFEVFFRVLKTAGAPEDFVNHAICLPTDVAS